LIIDTVDVHWVRESRSIGIETQFTKERVEANKKKEIGAYKRADIIWAVSQEDKKAIIEEIPQADVRIVSNIHSYVSTEYEDPGVNNLIFLGGYNHYPNISAALRLATKIFPLVKKEIKDAQLFIAGSNAPKEILDLDDLGGVKFIGWVEEQELASIYQQMTTSVVPLLSGAGVKGKITEAIAHMTPVVTNDIGNEGINLVDGQSILLAETDESFAEAIIKVFRRQVDLESITKNAQKGIEKFVTPTKVLSNIKSSLYRSVSICIVTYNRVDLLKACLTNVINYTTHPNYEIIVYSNGCSDGTKSYLQEMSKQHTHIKPIFSDTNDVFVRPNNHMMRLSEDHDIVLINNDVVVTQGWLVALSLTAYRKSDIGIVGSKILYPDGRLQEFGSVLYDDGTGMNIGKNDDDPYRSAYKSSKAAAYISGCAMYIKRSTINRIGTFDDQYHPCYCEDSDYCYTAWKHDLSTVVTPYSIVYHHEGSTSGYDTSDGFKRYQDINMKKFLSKHGHLLKKTNKKVSAYNQKLKKTPIEEEPR